MRAENFIAVVLAPFVWQGYTEESVDASINRVIKVNRREWMKLARKVVCERTR